MILHIHIERTFTTVSTVELVHCIEGRPHLSCPVEGDGSLRSDFVTFYLNRTTCEFCKVTECCHYWKMKG